MFCSFHLNIYVEKLRYPSLNGSGDLVTPFLNSFEDFMAETHAFKSIAKFLLTLFYNWKWVVVFKSIHFWHLKTSRIYKMILEALNYIQSCRKRLFNRLELLDI